MKVFVWNVEPDEEFAKAVLVEPYDSIAPGEDDGLERVGVFGATDIKQIKHVQAEFDKLRARKDGSIRTAGDRQEQN